ncbi:Calycin-like protein [Rhexocercosporidium sp. MPI-PUGE-AT-0058]|nr:Calycin-like protein [Rhexocercosporidium sp. MPI-PUGE-AT-0058]
MFSLPILLASTFLPALASSAKFCESTDLNLTVTESLWDGQCTYPKADRSFELNQYLGRWYQVAGTRAPFTARGSCIYAEYGLNDNGTVSVSNGCQLGNRSITIQGTADAADEIYGSDGVFRVQFPGRPGHFCPGPNYIVQQRSEDWAIVQASNFSTLFLLSREQNPGEGSIMGWLVSAGKLGSDLTDVIRTNQTGRLFT